MALNPSWLEVYKRDGVWKIANGKTRKVLQTAPTKREAVDKARQKAKYPNTKTGYLYMGVQVYDSNGNRGKRIVSPNSVKRWLKQSSRDH